MDTRLNRVGNRTALRRHAAFHQDWKEQRFLPLVMTLVGVNAQELHDVPKFSNVEPLPVVQRGDAS